MKLSLGKALRRASILMFFLASSTYAYIAFFSSKQGGKLYGLLGPEIVEGAGCGVAVSCGSGSGSGSGTGTSTGSGSGTGTSSSGC